MFGRLKIVVNRHVPMCHDNYLITGTHLQIQPMETAGMFRNPTPQSVGRSHVTVIRQQMT